MQQIVIVGCGIFGISAAVELRRRGFEVQVFDPGPVPHPLAASTDVSKAVRMEYGGDEGYLLLAEQAIAGWHRWNQEFGQELYHETGTLWLSTDPMAPGGFEYESWQALLRRGYDPVRVSSAELRERFPAWNAGRYVDGIFNPLGGFAESSRVVEALARCGQSMGVEIRQGSHFHRLLYSDSRVVGIETDRGEQAPADVVIAAVGSWTPHLFPSLANCFRSVGMPVFHLRPSRPELFEPARFPVFGADISRTGYYGFPLNEQGIVKVANHSTGRPMHPESPERAVTEEETGRLREFLAETFPSLAADPVVFTRVCLYCDTHDGHFWIDHDPEQPGLVVATGGSGHAFKFAPVLGALIADAVERVENPALARFAWRESVADSNVRR